MPPPVHLLVQWCAIHAECLDHMIGLDDGGLLAVLQVAHGTDREVALVDVDPPIDD